MSESRTKFPTANNQFRTPEDIPTHIRDSHEAVVAQWKKIDSSMGMTQLVRKEMDQLLKLGDLVDSDDVIKSAAKLVGGGIGAHAMASLLADMPQMDGEPIRLWLQGQDVKLRQREQALAPLHAVARHELGLSALRVLTAGHLEGQEPGAQGGARAGKLPMESPQMLMTENAPQPLLGMTPQGNA